MFSINKERKKKTKEPNSILQQGIASSTAAMSASNIDPASVQGKCKDAGLGFTLTTHDGPFYSMKHQERGKCVIFNHEKFTFKDPILPPRIGTKVDAAALRELFDKELGFEIVDCLDFTCKRIQSTISEVAQTLNDVDCLVVIVLTHCHESMRYFAARDGFYDPHTTLFEPLNGENCVSLAGKPKLFLIQTCYGDKAEIKLKKYVTDFGGFSQYKIPIWSDFVFFHSTVPGYLTWRTAEPPVGSFVIQKLVAKIRKHAHNLDLLSIFNLIKRKVHTWIKNNEPNIQKPRLTKVIVRDTLTRQLFFDVPQSDFTPRIPKKLRYDIKQGRCVIINNTIFLDTVGVENRPDAELDLVPLQTSFENLGFKVESYRNLWSDDIGRCVDEEARKCGPSDDCFALCISTHGVGPELLCAKESLYKLEEVLNLLQECPNLIGKPKIILVQSCQGDNKDKGVNVAVASNTDTINFGSRQPSSSIIYNSIQYLDVPSPDFLLVRTSYPGFSSYRRRKKGTWFFHTLIETLESFDMSHHLKTILAEVNRKICYEWEFDKNSLSIDSGAKQTCCVWSTLRHQIYFSGRNSL